MNLLRLIVPLLFFTLVACSDSNGGATSGLQEARRDPLLQVIHGHHLDRFAPQYPNPVQLAAVEQHLGEPGVVAGCGHPAAAPREESRLDGRVELKLLCVPGLCFYP